MGLADGGGVRIAKAIDRLLRALRTAPLGGSLAGEPGQNAWPYVDVRATPTADDDGARTSDVAGDEIPNDAPAELDSATDRASETVGAAWADVVEAEVTPAGPGPVGELETLAASSGAPEATAAEFAEHPTSLDADLDAHALARLEAASDLAESLGLGFHLGGAVERIVRGASEGKTGLKALREASWLIERYIALVEQRPVGADLHAESVRLNRAGEAIAGLRAISAALETERAPDSSLRVGYEADASEPPGKADPARPTVEESAPAPEVALEKRPFGHEVALMAVRWTIMVVSVIAVVLAVTLIGEWL